MKYHDSVCVSILEAFYHFFQTKKTVGVRNDIMLVGSEQGKDQLYFQA